MFVLAVIFEFGPLITTADLKKNPMTRLFILARLIIKLYLSFDI